MRVPARRGIRPGGRLKQKAPVAVGPGACLAMRPGEQAAARAGYRLAYLATGMVNSAPLAMLSGQRCITLL
jgi:hypothetical protein